jgi:non-canonical (house-cleaning) NTP pyrophosphatase
LDGIIETAPPILVAVGSTRRPKLDAVRAALDILGPKLAPHARFEIVGREVDSGVRETPVGHAESMLGARHRAEALARIAREENLAWQYFVGLEGGLEVVEDRGRRTVFLASWAYVADASGRGAFGQSGAIQLPGALAAEVIDNRVSLSAAIDAFAARRGIRDAEGAWGVLTAGLISRRDSFRFALINAFALFYNASMYASPGARDPSR